MLTGDEGPVHVARRPQSNIEVRIRHLGRRPLLVQEAVDTLLPLCELALLGDDTVGILRGRRLRQVLDAPARLRDILVFLLCCAQPQHLLDR